jgi:uncharacterized protein YeaO (DUF488 family)
MIYVKRVYEPAEQGDGARFLVDHLWPRGFKKEDLKADKWMKEVAPSGGLCKWFAHDPAKWKEFQHRYFAELNGKPEAWQALARAAQASDVTLLYSARDTEHNNAVALRAYLTKRMPGRVRGKRGKLDAA